VALTIDWNTKIILVPRADMLLVQSVPTEIRELDIDAFRLELKSIEAGEGMPFVDTHRHNAPVTVGGVTLARVVEIINGYTITFEDGQYAVNLVGANSNISDVTNVNQVSVRSANSAGLTYSKEIEDQSFLDSRVFIDTIDGLSGTQFPRGTPGDPTNTYADGLGIVNNRSLASRFWLRNYLVADPSEDMDGQDWLGWAPTISKITVQFTPAVSPHAGPGTNKTVFANLTLTGSGNGPFELSDGVLDTFSGFEGSLFRTGLNGTVQLPNQVSDDLFTFVDCYSLVPGTGTPIFDMNDATAVEAQFRRYAGGIEIQNCTSSDNVISIDLTSGHIALDSTVTAGTFVIRGTGHLTDNSTGTTIITDGFTPVWTTAEKDATLIALSSIADTIALLQKYQENRQVIDKTLNTLTIYDDDDITPILVFSLLDSLGSPSTDEVAERLPQ
jgi:hypothetical protein